MELIYVHTRCGTGIEAATLRGCQLEFKWIGHVTEVLIFFYSSHDIISGFHFAIPYQWS